MTYTSKTAKQLRQQSGTLLKKIATELALIAARINLSGDGTVTDDGVLTITDDAVTTAKIKDANVTQVKIAAASLDGTVAKVVAESNVIGGIPQTFLIPLTAGDLADTDITVTHKIRVIDAYLILRGAGVASTTLQVKNAADAITDAMAASGSDQALVRAAGIDDAHYEIAAGGTLRVTSASGATQPAALVVVTAVRVA